MQSKTSYIPEFQGFSLGVVAHDAGAANHIIAWLKVCNHEEMHVCLEGPAALLWEHSFPDGPPPLETLSEVISRSNVLLTGTGWASTLEHDARKSAKSAGLKSIAVIDHWTNYRERFVRNGEEVLPDEIWVVDEYAKKLAEGEFPNLKVVQLPNVYLEKLVREVRDQEHDGTKANQDYLLYVLEPIRQVWGENKQSGEFQALDFFVENLSCLGLSRNLLIVLRPHPSDSQGKYDSWIHAQKNLQISLDESPSLASSIAAVNTVVGCQTYAMVIALAAGRRVFSSIPPWAPSCILPQAGIVKLAVLVH